MKDSNIYATEIIREASGLPLEELGRAVQLSPSYAKRGDVRSMTAGALGALAVLPLLEEEGSLTETQARVLAGALTRPYCGEGWGIPATRWGRNPFSAFGIWISRCLFHASSVEQALEWFEAGNIPA